MGILNHLILGWDKINYTSLYIIGQGRYNSKLFVSTEINSRLVFGRDSHNNLQIFVLPMEYRLAFKGMASRLRCISLGSPAHHRPMADKRADKFCRQMRAEKAGKSRGCADLSAKHADKCRQILQTKKKEAASALASRRVSLINFRYIGYPWGIIA